MTIHKITNGEGNKIFKIEGELATVISVSGYGKVESEQMATDEARKLYAFGKEMGWTKGFTRLQAYKRLTTWEQLGAYVDQAFDMTSDNDPEAALAVEESFRGCGYFEVEA